jgi:hypothetical protein
MSWIRKLFIFIRDAFVIFVIALLTLEFFSFLLCSNRMLPFNEKPLAYARWTDDFIDMKSWRTESSSWGSWHRPNSKTRQITKCFDATYSSNEIGARDDSFLKTFDAKKTYILIGDSFAEGLGVNFADTAQSIIEKKTGLALLNFGSAGNFGPVQYSILYNQLAKKYPHNGLIIFFLPDNDFTDNDPAASGQNDTNAMRWRPYYKANPDGSFDSFIPKNSVKKDDLTPPIKKAIPFKIENYFWFYNIYKTIKYVFIKNSYNPIKIQSGYFDAPIDEQKAAVFFIDKLILDTSAKDIILVSIPRKQDLMRIAEGADKTKLFWHKAFETSGQRLNKSVIFIDLSDYAKPHQIDNLFLECDGHWSADGNKWAAEIISNKINKSKSMIR